jgi:hypothetical protein
MKIGALFLLRVEREMLGRAFIVLGAIALAPTAFAADINGASATYGVGGIPCKTILSDKRFSSDQNTKSQMMNWFSGYISAVNTITPDTFDVSPIHSDVDLYNLLFKKCSEYPFLTFQQASQRIINILFSARSSSQSNLLELKNEYGSTFLRSDTLSKIQNNLKVLRLFDGYIDGKVTPAIMISIKKFQADHSLPKTGLPDSSTILKILIEPVTKAAESTKR